MKIKTMDNWQMAFRNSLRSLMLVLLAISIAACSSEPPPIPQKEIVGKWVNSSGGWIEFYANGTGFVPGVKGEIADASFNYSFTDNMHMLITIRGQLSTVVEIRVQGDKMTWMSQPNSVTFEYTREKS